MSGSQVKPQTEFGSFRTVSRSTRTWSGRPWALSGRSRRGAGGTREGVPTTPSGLRDALMAPTPCPTRPSWNTWGTPGGCHFDSPSK